MNLVIFIIGILVGAFLYWVFAERKHVSGSVVVDLTDLAESPITLKFSESINSIYTKKQIVLNVEIREDDSLN